LGGNAYVVIETGDLLIHILNEANTTSDVSS
jgi:hypothetical protein